jgi:hypothetical protein
MILLSSKESTHGEEIDEQTNEADEMVLMVYGHKAFSSLVSTMNMM